MPQIFKALASITVWVLFIAGLLAMVAVIGLNIVTGGLSTSPPPWHLFAGLIFAITSLILAVVAMKLRQMLE